MSRVERDEKDELKGFKVNFDDDYDPANPKCWPRWYRMCIVAGFSFTSLATGIYSTTYTSGIAGMSEDLHIGDPSLPSLGLSLYLIGLALGALIMAPLSETFGRRPMYIAGLSVFLAFIPVAALATSFIHVLVARFLG
jgi:MFS family permease